jgi:hypothetical protein
MKKSSFLKTILYLGVILLLFMISKAFNSLSALTLNNTKTIRVAQDRFKLDELEFQIEDALNNYSKKQTFSGNKIQEIDDDLNRFEQQLAAGKFPKLESIKKKWERLKNQSTPDSTEVINELKQLHRMINKNILEDITNREATNERDLSRLKILKIANAVVIIFLVFIAMYLDTIQGKQREELLKKLQDSEKKNQESLDPRLDSHSPANTREYLDTI